MFWWCLDKISHKIYDICSDKTDKFAVIAKICGPLQPNLEVQIAAGRIVKTVPQPLPGLLWPGVPAGVAAGVPNGVAAAACFHDIH